MTTEDVAIHKSVAQYVDSKYRKQATASTCYEKHSGEFLPIKDSDNFQYSFREEYKDKEKFIRTSDISNDNILDYLNTMIDFIKLKPKQ